MLGEDLLTGLGQQEVDEGLRLVDVAGPVEHHRVVPVRHCGGLGKRQQLQVAVARLDVGDVDETGVEITGADLRRQGPHVRFLGVQSRVDPGEREGLGGQVAARHARSAGPQEQIPVGERLQAGDVAGVPGWDPDHE